MPEASARRRPPIGMGDALLAARTLALTESEDLSRLVRLLGLHWSRDPGVVAAPEPGDDFGPEQAPAHVAIPGPPAPSGEGPPQDPAAAHPERPDDEGPTWLARHTVAEDLGLDQSDVIALPPVEPLAPLAPTVEVVPYAAPVPRQQVRAALSRLLRQPRIGTEVDVDELVHRLSERQPLTEIPYLRQVTLDRGVTVLADVGPSMLPYLADVAHLVDEVREVVGDPQVDVDWISEPPARTPFVSAGRPVLVISSLGAGNGARVRAGRARAWRQFADAAAGADLNLTALTPQRSAGVAASTRRGFSRLVAWDDLPDVGRGHATAAVGGTRGSGGSGRPAAQTRSPEPASRPDTGRGRAEYLLAAAAARDPGLVDLARLASLACVVEPALLRRLRLAVLPSLGLGVEADLWFSRLTHVASATLLTLHPDVAEVLREQAAQPKHAVQARLARQVVQRAHAGHSDALRLEDELIWAAVEGHDAAIEAGLHRVLHTLTLGGSRADEVAGWVLQARRRLPRRVLARPAGTQLLAAVALYVERTVPAEVLALDRFPPAAAGTVPTSLRTRTVGVELHHDGLRFSDPPAEDSVALPIPATRPPVVEVSWADETGRTRSAVVSAEPGTFAVLPGVAAAPGLTTPGVNTRGVITQAAERSDGPALPAAGGSAQMAPVRLRTLDGRRHRLHVGLRRVVRVAILGSPAAQDLVASIAGVLAETDFGVLGSSAQPAQPEASSEFGPPSDFARSAGSAKSFRPRRSVPSAADPEGDVVVRIVHEPPDLRARPEVLVVPLGSASGRGGSATSLVEAFLRAVRRAGRRSPEVPVGAIVAWSRSGRSGRSTGLDSGLDALLRGAADLPMTLDRVAWDRDEDAGEFLLEAVRDAVLAVAASPGLLYAPDPDSALQVLQSLSMEFHLRLFAGREGARRGADLLGLKGPDQRPEREHEHVRSMAEYLFTGPVRTFLDGAGNPCRPDRNGRCELDDFPGIEGLDVPRQSFHDYLTWYVQRLAASIATVAERLGPAEIPVGYRVPLDALEGARLSLPPALQTALPAEHDRVDERPSQTEDGPRVGYTVVRTQAAELVRELAAPVLLAVAEREREEPPWPTEYLL